MTLADNLPEIYLSPALHIGCPRVSQMRVVRPDDDLRLGTTRPQMSDERVERIGHMEIAKVP